MRKFECGNLVKRVLDTLRCHRHLHRMRNEERQWKQSYWKPFFGGYISGFGQNDGDRDKLKIQNAILPRNFRDVSLYPCLEYTHDSVKVDRLQKPSSTPLKDFFRCFLNLNNFHFKAWKGRNSHRSYLSNVFDVRYTIISSTVSLSDFHSFSVSVSGVWTLTEHW